MLLVTAHVKVCHLAYGDVCFVNLFRRILPAVPTECDVLIACGQHNDKEWKFKEQRAKMWENIAGRRDTLAAVVSTLRGERPRHHAVPMLYTRWCRANTMH